MKLKAICFTDNGKRIIDKLRSHYEVDAYIKMEAYTYEDGFTRLEEPLSKWVQAGFFSRDILVFVGALGIAVRSIADRVWDKLTDSTVNVIDDNGNYVIPVLSGHMGGANEIAMDIADKLGTIPVITTSTDNNCAFSVDLFAKEQGLGIGNRDGIKKVNAKAIQVKAITMSIKNYPSEDMVYIVISDEEQECEYGIHLIPKKYIVGMGFKKGKCFEELEDKLKSYLNGNNLNTDDIYALATIDIKADEEGLQELSRRYRIPIMAFDSKMLEKAPGEYTSSDFVKETVGVDNVCERAAVLASGCRGRIVNRKQAFEGVTFALVERNI